MTAFRYRAMAADGSVVKGTMNAANEAAVIQHIRDQGHYPISTASAETQSLLGSLRALAPSQKPSPRALALATQELATLLQAGLELDRALSILTALDDMGSLRQSFVQVRARVRDGAGLAEAMSSDPVFPKFYVAMVRAGEMGGALDATLRKLSDYLTRSLAIRETVSSALVYPALLFVASGVSIIFILFFVLPQFEPLFEQAGTELPLPTKIAIGLGDFLRGFWWLLIALVIGAYVAARRALERPDIRTKVDRWLLRVPLLGHLVTAMEVERFCRTLGTLLTNGVPLPTALGLAKDVMWNRVLADAVRETATSLREGEGVAARLARTGVFPAVTLDLIRIGEEAGKLDEMLLRHADLDEQRIKHTIDRLLALLVPGLTIVMGMIVAGLIASLLVAILSINDLALQ